MLYSVSIICLLCDQKSTVLYSALYSTPLYCTVFVFAVVMGENSCFSCVWELNSGLFCCVFKEAGFPEKLCPSSDWQSGEGGARASVSLSWLLPFSSVCVLQTAERKIGVK